MHDKSMGGLDVATRIKIDKGFSGAGFVYLTGR